MEEKELVKIFKALCNETRLKIIKQLLDGEKCVCEMVSSINRSQPNISIQLSRLENIGIIESRRDGKKVYYKIKNNKIREMLRVLED